VNLLTILSFVFFTSLVGFATYLLTRGDDHESSEGYFLAGRRLTGGLIAGSLLLTNLSTEQLVGINGQAYTDGLSIMAWEVIAAVALVAMALFFLPRYLKSGIATLPQYLEERYDKRTRTITTVIFIGAYATILLPIILYTGATNLSKILNVKDLTGLESEWGALWLTVCLIGIVGSIYAIFGGLRTVAVSDTINGFGLLVGGVMITICGLQAVAVDSGSFLDGWQILREELPEKFNSVGASDQLVPFSTLFSGVFLLHVFYWCTNQQIIQRTLGASSLREGQRGVLIAACFKIFAPLIVVIPGMIAFYLYGKEGIHSDHAYGTLVSNVLPKPLVGFFAAVIVGAVLSTFNSVLNSTATLFSLGLYKAHLNPGATQSQIIGSGKLCGAVVAIYAMATAPWLIDQRSIFDYMAKMNGLYSIPIFSVVVVGMLSKRVPALAANMALLLGLASIAVGYFVYPKDFVQIHEFHFLGIVFISLIVLMLVIGSLKPREQAFEQHPSGDVDLTPWRWAKPVGVLILLTVFSIYRYFADFSVLASQ